MSSTSNPTNNAVIGGFIRDRLSVSKQMEFDLAMQRRKAELMKIEEENEEFAKLACLPIDEVKERLAAVAPPVARVTVPRHRAPTGWNLFLKQNKGKSATELSEMWRSLAELPDETGKNQAEYEKLAKEAASRADTAAAQVVWSEIIPALEDLALKDNLSFLIFFGDIKARGLSAPQYKADSFYGTRVYEEFSNMCSTNMSAVDLYNIALNSTLAKQNQVAPEVQQQILETQMMQTPSSNISNGVDFLDAQGNINISTDRIEQLRRTPGSTEKYLREILYHLYKKAGGTNKLTPYKNIKEGKAKEELISDSNFQIVDPSLVNHDMRMKYIEEVAAGKMYMKKRQRTG